MVPYAAFGGKRRFQQDVLSWILAGALLYFLYRVVETFLSPLLWAGVLTIFFFPMHRLVRERVPHPNFAALVSVLAVLIVLVTPSIWLIPAFVREALATISSLPSREVLGKLTEVLQQWMESLPASLGNVQDIVREASRSARGLIAGQSAAFAGNVATSLFHMIVMMLTMFYLFRDGPQVLELLKDVSPFRHDHRDRIMHEVTELISVTVTSGLIVSIVQGIVGGLVFWVLGMPAPLFWGVMIAFLAFLPMIGPFLIWAPAAIGLALNGETGRAIAMGILGFVLVSGVDNVLRPLLIAGRSQMNGLLVFVSVLGGLNAFGLIGVILGPVIVATAVGLMKGYRESLRETGELPSVPEAA